MSRRERAKGVRGEAEVLKLLTAGGFAVRGLEGTGDHLAVGHGLLLHVETKRQETARPWAWWEQASNETPEPAVTVVAFRRSHSRWLAMVDLEVLIGLLADGRGSADSISMADAQEMVMLASREAERAETALRGFVRWCETVGAEEGNPIFSLYEQGRAALGETP